MNAFPVLLPDGKVDPFRTHRDVLRAVVEHTVGPVLELGVGYGSTKMLHALCEPTERELVSVESSVEWFAKFSHLERPWHRMLRLDDLDECEEIDRDGWAVAFVDHSPYRRAIDIKRLMNHARFLVVHDTESDQYLWETLPEFRYRVDCKRFSPWTSAMSMIEPLPAGLELL